VEAIAGGMLCISEDKEDASKDFGEAGWLGWSRTACLDRLLEEGRVK